MEVRFLPPAQPICRCRLMVRTRKTSVSLFVCTTNCRGSSVAEQQERRDSLSCMSLVQIQPLTLTGVAQQDRAGWPPRCRCNSCPRFPFQSSTLTSGARCSIRVHDFNTLPRIKTFACITSEWRTLSQNNSAEDKIVSRLAHNQFLWRVRAPPAQPISKACQMPSRCTSQIHTVIILADKTRGDLGEQTKRRTALRGQRLRSSSRGLLSLML